MLAPVLDKLVSSVQRYINAQHELSIQIDLTNACNLRCKHCYHSHHDNEGALTFEGWMEVLDRYEGLLTKLRLLLVFT